MIRDKRKDETYFSSTIQRIHTKNEEHIKFIEKGNARPIAYFMAATGLSVEFSWRYSTGEDLKSLKNLYDIILDYYIASIENNDIYNVTLKVISVGILLEADHKKLNQLYELIQKYKQNDLIFSSLLHAVLHTKEIYPKLRFKKSKSLLQLEKIFTSNKEDAQSLMKEYLEKLWYTKENLGDDYDSNRHNKDNCASYWSWESAAIVKVLNLDDSSFKDNEFYPYDLAHWNG